MTLPQLRALQALGPRAHTATEIAERIDASPVVVGKIKHALARRNYVTVAPSGRWYATERGRARVSTVARGRCA